MIVAQDVTIDANDKQQLDPVLEEWTDMNGQVPSKMSIDAGYWSKANAELEDNQTELFIATIKDWKRGKQLQ